MPDYSMSLPMAGLLCCTLLCPGSMARAATALDCLPPLPPAPVSDGATRATYAAEIREEYVTYFDEAPITRHSAPPRTIEVATVPKRSPLPPSRKLSHDPS